MYLFNRWKQNQKNIEEPQSRGCHHRSCHIHFPVRLPWPFSGIVYLSITIQTIWPEQWAASTPASSSSSSSSLPTVKLWKLPVAKCLVHASTKSRTQLQGMQRWKLHLHWGSVAVNYERVVGEGWWVRCILFGEDIIKPYKARIY